jgi:chain length determinant protein EpsF
MNLRQILLVLRLRWWLVLSIFLVVVIATFVISIMLPKRYSAEAQLLLEENRSDPLLAQVAPAWANPAFLATQVQIIRSDRVASRVVEVLGLAKDPKAIADWREATDGRVPIEAFIGGALQKSLEVVPQQGSSLLNVSFTAGDAKLAADAANAFAQAYLELSVELRVEPARQYNTFFDDRIKQLRADLEAAQAKLSAFQRDKGIVASDERLDAETARLNAILQQVSAARAEQVDSISRSRNAGSETSPDVQASLAVQSLRTELARAETRLSEVSNVFGSNHPQRIQLETQVSQLKQQIAAEMRRVSGATATVSRVSSAKVGELQAMADAQKKQVLAMREVRDQMSVLQKDLETAQRAYEAVATRRSQTSLESKADQANAKLLSPAVTPFTHSKPSIPKNMAAAVVLGLILGIAASMAWEMLDRRVRSVSDLLMAEGVPVLGVLSPKAGRAWHRPHGPRGPLQLGAPGGGGRAPQLTLDGGN